MPKVVSDSSPIIHLEKMGYLHLLEKIYQKVCITDHVYEECTGGLFQSQEILKEIEDIKQASFLEINSIKNIELYLALSNLVDEGEASAIALALESQADLTLLDDGDARDLADIYNLNYTGTIGVLLKARELRLIQESAAEILDMLKSTGFFITEELTEYIVTKYQTS